MGFNDIIMAVVLFFAVTGVQAESQHLSDESCRKNVAEKIKGIETMQTSTGSEVKLAGLSIADIKRIQIVKGDCAASEEINLRMVEANKKSK